MTVFVTTGHVTGREESARDRVQCAVRERPIVDKRCDSRASYRS